MANDSNKKRLKQNESRIRTLKRVQIIYWTLYILVRVILHRKTSVAVYITSVISFFTNLKIYRLFYTISQPKEQADGSQVAGTDYTHGVMSYVCDIMYVTLFCNFLTLFGNVMVYSYLLLPIGFVAVLWSKIVKPWLFNDDFNERIQRENAEKREQYLKYLQREQNRMKYGGKGSGRR